MIQLIDLSSLKPGIYQLNMTIKDQLIGVEKVVAMLINEQEYLK